MATLAEQPAPEGGAGWHSDPLGSDKLRYFDGIAWTKKVQVIGQPAARARKKKGGFPRPHWRKMTWVIILWCIVMAAWIIGGLTATDTVSECAHEAHRYLAQPTCTEARNTGAGLAVIALWFVWFFGFIVLSLIWFMSRPRGRTCPACGEKVKKGRTTCPECNHDFAAAAMAAPPPAST